MVNWAGRPAKAEVRGYQLDVAGPRRVALFLPGWDIVNNTGCLCVKQALKEGLIDENTLVIAVERDARLAPFIEGELKRLGLNYRMHTGGLHSLQLDHPVDFAFLDFIGGLQQDVVLWLSEYLQVNIAEHAAISITLGYSSRANNFIKKCDVALKNKYPKLCREFYHRYDIDDWIILRNLLIIRSIFFQYNYRYRRVIKYQDTTTMLAFKFEDFQYNNINTANLPSIYEILDIEIPQRLKRLRTNNQPLTGDRLMNHKTKIDQILETLNKIPNLFIEGSLERSISENSISTLKKLILDKKSPSQQTRPVNSASARAFKAWETRRANGWVHPAHRQQESVV